ncbi:uncharacterized protein MONOS_3540 [Monocercomonoides exilis]|uniref:uncharacterized protein n=1 Tax=Monocercomonoides exilis TaxID=2049356 RepID=UPI003559DD43|nr:hypothetical protein MONOS_3540 [Monocercomonoides exilis]|eukprot:MONOS_3540.1-p1 / transcript=MONOS_3540.1 / gene=MONOS_3540 / organism=Monocercomonoides_exilis_PA203 / gene_product=unspecified product / transcript_product=unspecified product / location=Mono_scaffold00084:28529-37630(+) / protein_length=3033 / sequence_SO=supercontig / SO=protein_coding / is_pseudo=false
MVHLQNDVSSGIKLINSHFSDFKVLSSKSSSLLCSGIGSYETVYHCCFMNITTKVKTGNEAAAKENHSFVLSSTIKLSAFIHVHDAFYGGIVHGLSFTSPSQDFVCDLCEFYDCSHSTPSSLFHVSQAKQSITGKNANITSTIFKDCTGTNGGGLYFDGEIIGVNYNLTVQDCVFENCSANYGGGIYINEVGYGTIQNNVFYDCKATYDLGPDFYVHNFDWTTKDVDITFSSSFTYNDGNRVHMDGANYSKLIKMDPYQIVASAGNATVNCGLNTSTACKSVNTAISNRRPNYLKRIKLLNGTYNETDSWTINSARGKVDAFGESQTKVIFNLNKYTGSSMISISGAVNISISTFTINVNKDYCRIISGSSYNFNLSVSDITISTPSSWTTYLSYSLFNFVNGTLSFSRVTTKNIRLATNCLFQMANGVTKAAFSLCNFTNITISNNNSAIFSAGYLPKSLALSNCSISSISSLNSTGVNGGVLCLDADSPQISFANTTFTSCCVSSSSGRGGALHISANGSLSKFVISRCQFSSNQACFGRDVFICVPSLPNANLDSYYSSAATSTYVPNRTNAWFGSDDATFQGDFDLMPFIFGYTSSIIHASNASRGDGKYCGSVIAHCRTITQAVQRLNGSSPTVKANGTVAVSSSGTDVSNVTIRRNESATNATITLDGITGTANSALISSGVFQSLNVDYSVDSAPRGSSIQILLSGSSGVQTFTNCIFVGSASNALTISLVSISGGSLVLENSLLTASGDLRCSRSSFIIQNGNFDFSSCSFANLIFTSAKAGLISQSGSGSSSQQIELFNCSFERISSTKETSSCVVISSSACKGSFNATLCIFSSSSCTNSIDGGAISFAIGANKKFEIDGCEISSNTASESAGKGGGVFLLMKEMSSDYRFSDCSFESNKAKHGKDIYIQAPNLNACVSYEKFGIAFTSETDVGNMMFGCNSSSVDEHVDLILLLVGHKAIVNVKNAGSEHGKDWFRCGNESDPCLTVEYGMDKILDSTAENKGLSIITQAVISKPIDLSSMTILSSSSSSPSRLLFNVASAAFDAVILNHDSLTFNKIELYLPSVQNVLKALISTDSSLIADDTSFESEELDSSIYLTVIEVIAGTVLLDNCSIGEHSFFLEGSFIKYAGSSTIALNQTSIGAIILSSTFFTETTGGQGILSLTNTSFTQCSASPLTTMSPIISSQLEGAVNINECNFSDVGSPECKEGGVINVWLKDTGEISIAGCKIEECFCNEATGKGGFLYLSKRQSEGQYDLSAESEYSNNRAHIGKNLFFDFDSLNASVSADKLFLPVGDPAAEGGKEYVGKDAIFDSMDLAAFLVQFVSDKVHVSSTGYDILRCGSADFPCHSIWRGLNNVKNDSSDKEIILGSLVEVESCFEFLDLTLSASSTSKEAGITICSDLSPSNKDTVIDITGCCNFANVIILLPSEFIGQQLSVIKSSASEGVLKLSSCNFGKQSDFPSPIECSLIFVTDGKLLFHSCTVENLLFSASPFVIAQSVNATFEKSRLLSVTLQTSSLFIAAEAPVLQKQLKNAGSCEFIFTNCSFDDIITKEGNSESIIQANTLSLALSLINCSITRLTALESNEGGGMKIKFREGGSLSVKGYSRNELSVVSSCSCSQLTGKGGFCFIDSTGADANFVFEKTIFSDNAASLGKNVFITCTDICNSVKSNQVLIQLEDWTSDAKAFSGMDTKYFTDKAVDLLTFFVDYFSEKIVVSAIYGADIICCGRDILPCSSFSTGMQHVTRSPESEPPTSQLLIENSANVENCFDLSDCEILSTQNAPALFSVAASLTSSSSSTGSEDSVFFNSKELKLTFLTFSVPAEFTSSQSVLILSSSGKFYVNKCSVLISTDISDAISYCLVEVRSGLFEMKDFSLRNLSFDSKPLRFWAADFVGKIEDCLFEGLRLRYPLLSMSERSTPFLEGSQSPQFAGSSLMSGGCELELVSCRMIDIIRENDGSCLLSCGISSNAKYQINGCVLKNCESGISRKGGSMMLALGSGNSDMIMLDVNSTSLGKCIASTTFGKGGGVYLDCENILDDGKSDRLSNDNPLGFLFKNVHFSFNNASSGRDVFILCVNIDSQVTEDQFLIDFDESVFDSQNAIFGRDSGMNAEEGDRDLIEEVIFFRGEQVLVSSNGENGKRCGSFAKPCRTIEVGVKHVSEGRFRTMFVDLLANVEGEVDLSGISVEPLDKSCTVSMNSPIAKSAEREWAISTEEDVEIDNVAFVFGSRLKIAHSSLVGALEGKLRMNGCSFIGSENGIRFDGSLITVAGGTFLISESAFSDFAVKNYIINCESGATANMESIVLERISGKYLISCQGSTVTASQLMVSSAKAQEAVISCSEKATLSLLQSELKNIEVKEGSAICVDEGEILATNDREVGSEKAFSASLCIFSNISCGGSEGRTIFCLTEKSVQLFNNTLGCCSCQIAKGQHMSVFCSRSLIIDACTFDGWREISGSTLNSKATEEICKWNGSLVEAAECKSDVKYSTFSNSSEGALSVRGGSLSLAEGEFSSNKPGIDKYDSVRRNMLCSDSGVLDVVSLKGGDGVLPSSSMWILNDGCVLKGIAGERASPFFIPTLHSVETEENENLLNLIFRGTLLLPCNLSFRIVLSVGDVEQIEACELTDTGFVSEEEVHGAIGLEMVRGAEASAEVRVCIVFGDADSPSTTQTFILKNRSEPERKGEDDAAKGAGKSEWGIAAFVACMILLLIALVAFAIIVALLRRKLKDAEKKAEKARWEYAQIVERLERQKEESRREFEMSEMPSTLLEGMTSQIPLLIDNDEEDLPDPPSMSNDGILNENDLPDLESPLPFSENASASGIPQSHSFNVISAKNPFREKEKKNIKTLYSAIHSVQGNFTMGTRAMDVVDGKKVVLAVAELFEHLISVGDERVEMMGKQLCPYTIFVEEGNENEIYLLTKELIDEKQKEEMKRWKAPEAGDEEEGIEKAVVFTLGLILHEMTTGEVPLSECNAEEAQEMMRDGVRPLTEGIEGEELIEVIEKMWGDEPNGRPSLAEVIALLKE